MSGSSRRVMVAVLGVALAASVAAALPSAETHITPTPQPPVAAIADRDLTPVKALFDHDADRPRILVLLSPT